MSLYTETDRKAAFEGMFDILSLSVVYSMLLTNIVFVSVIAKREIPRMLTIFKDKRRRKWGLVELGPLLLRSPEWVLHPRTPRRGQGRATTPSKPFKQCIPLLQVEWLPVLDRHQPMSSTILFQRRSSYLWRSSKSRT